MLASQQKEENSLAELRRMGDEQFDGLMVEENGVLVQAKLIAPLPEERKVLMLTDLNPGTHPLPTFSGWS